jgi:hypothetical protein
VFDRDREDGPFTPQEPHGLSTSSTENGLSQGAATPSEWDPLCEMFVSPNPHVNEKSLKNPISHWRVSKRKITGM